MKTKHAGIYEIVINRVGMPTKRYIGQSKNVILRCKTHLRALQVGNHYNDHLQAAFNKYGGTSVSTRTVLVCSPDKATLAMYEQLVVDFHGKDLLYNIKIECVVSSLGTKATPERCAKIAKAITGIKRSDSTRAKISIAQAWKRTEAGKAKMSAYQSGRIPSDETRLKMSISHKGRVMSKESTAKTLATKARNAVERGSYFSSEGLANMSAANKLRTGFKHTADTLAKMSAAHVGSVHTQETKDKIRIQRTGVPQSDSHRENSRLGHMGVRPTPETRAKLSIIRTGTKRSLETRIKMAESQKRVVAEKRARGLDILGRPLKSIG